jgi:hypothetical protein
MMKVVITYGWHYGFIILNLIALLTYAKLCERDLILIYIALNSFAPNARGN